MFRSVTFFTFHVCLSQRYLTSNAVFWIATIGQLEVYKSNELHWLDVKRSDCIAEALVVYSLLQNFWLWYRIQLQPAILVGFRASVEFWLDHTGELLNYILSFVEVFNSRVAGAVSQLPGHLNSYYLLPSISVPFLLKSLAGHCLVGSCGDAIILPTTMTTSHQSDLNWIVSLCALCSSVRTSCLWVF